MELKKEAADALMQVDESHKRLQRKDGSSLAKLSKALRGLKRAPRLRRD